MQLEDDDRRRMVRHDLKGRGIQDARVLDAMGRIPREVFVLPADAPLAYADRALPIACAQTISQPYMVALMSEALQLSGSERVLEIGTGSGYQTAVLAELAREVISIERHQELSDEAAERLTKLGYANIVLLVGDGTRGAPQYAPFDRILITAAAPTCPPALWDQLAEGGILVGPFGSDDSQWLEAVRKQNGEAERRHLVPCRFVPFVAD
jgi:protein-L-isoaspartate(D-aspartate) O-methyltransferase